MTNIRMLAERKRLGMTTQEVADAIGVHQNTYINWETGDSTPMSDNLMRLACLYSCSAEYLLGIADGRNDSAIAPNSN